MNCIYQEDKQIQNKFIYSDMNS